MPERKQWLLVIRGEESVPDQDVFGVSGDAVDARVQLSDAAVGGGGAPGQRLPSTAVSLPADLAVALRSGTAVRNGSVPAVVGRIEDGRLLLDLRAVAPADDELLIAAVMAAAG